MRNGLFGFPKNGCGVSNALSIQDDTRDMLRQMMLPLIPQRRVKGALSVVSRETGLPFSKVRRVYYGITDHILAFEWSAIAMAYQKHVEDSERRLTIELDNLRALKMARQQRGLFDADQTARPRTDPTAMGLGADES